MRASPTLHLPIELPAGAHARLRVIVQGTVQGVGFRPFIYGLAQRWCLGGFVRNDAAGVTMEIEGEPGALAAFIQALRSEPPPLAVIERMTSDPIPARGDTTFTITPSAHSAEKQAFVSPDVCTCEDCLAELFDPADRRYRYPFINCTNCGPRFTIIQDVPYDRPATTMSAFPMCPACRAEYENPRDRRFHAQPNACPVCGPQVRWRHGADALAGDDAVREAQRLLRCGAIVSVKGLGGFHLACDATNEAAVARLRARKQREDKPFALMTADVATIRSFCHVSAEELALLSSRQRPIVLLRRRDGAVGIAGAVAPGVSDLGWMLPYTPLHHLLLHGDSAVAKEDAATPLALVMTSGNRSDEPIAYQDEEAFNRLGGIADAFLTHDREIHVRCDDSVARCVGSGKADAAAPVQFLRRSRGYAPRPIGLAWQFPKALLAVGPHLKNTFCLGKGRFAYMGPHIGDLENLETLHSFREGIDHFQRLFDIEPEAVAYDLHPGYLATQHALESAIPEKIGVQHHHAHIASVMAEHGREGPLIGVAADGTGYGTDGALWGGEILVADLRSFERAAHLAYVPLPGGEQAIRQPWRMAAVYLQRAFGNGFLELELPLLRREGFAGRWRPLARMIERGVNSPPTSSMGRLFDGVAALLGVREQVLYEGQASIELETLAAGAEPVLPLDLYPFAVNGDTLDPSPLVRAIVADLLRGTAAPAIARRFHESVAAMLARACARVREERGLDEVVLSGGVFQNRLLLEQTLERLRALKFQVYINRIVPPNDGGVSLGQAAVAAARLRHSTS